MITPQQSILAICVTQAKSAKDIISQLSTFHFEVGTNSRIFLAIKEIIAKEIEPNTIALLNHSKNTNTCSKQDVLELSQWSNQLTYNENVSDLLIIIKDEYIKIQILKSAQAVSQKIVEGNDGLSTALEAINEIRSIIDQEVDSSKTLTPLQMMINESEAYDRRAILVHLGKATGVDTGLRVMNQFTGGWQKGELIVMAARPSMGKTALALFHMLEAAKFGVPTIFFNLEMNESQLSQRLIVQQCNAAISPQNLKLGKLSQTELHEFIKAKSQIEAFPFVIYDKGGASISEIVRAIKTANLNGQCEFAIIDYMQLITGDDSKGKNREQEIAYISRTLKQTAKELNIPILALAQLSRAVEQRGGLKKPILSDLRESGAIEQDADAVIFVWRPKYYNLNDDENKPYDNEMFYLVEKNRTGAVGEAAFKTNYCVSNFYDFTQELPSHLPYEDKKEAMKSNFAFDSEQLDF
jgi:replicative DNA helicase